MNILIVGTTYTKFGKDNRDIGDLNLETCNQTLENANTNIGRIEKIGIIGTGIMGVQLAEIIIRYGFKVVLKSRNNEHNTKTIKKIEERLLRRMSPEEKDKILQNITFTTEFAELTNMDLVIECIIENEEAKKELFRKLEKVCSNKTIFSSNTSSLSIDIIGSSIHNPKRIICTHFFNPVEKMQLVEINQGKFTSQETTNSVVNFVKILEKKPIIIRESPGGIVNRLLFSLINEAGYMLEEGKISKEEIDKAMKMGVNHPMGPLELSDFIGIDITYEILRKFSSTIPDFKLPAPIFKKMIEEGKLGKKVNRGFYDYQSVSR